MTGSVRAKSESLYTVTHPGLEEVLAKELAGLGLSPLAIERGGVAVEGSPRDLYRMNLRLRTASRVTVRLAQFHARTFPELERHARRIAWNRVVRPGEAVHLRVTAKKSRLNHERAIAERLARGLQERVGSVRLVESRGELDQGERDLEPTLPIQRFVIRMFRDQCVVSADSSGSLLHRRGYRLETAKAPLRETLASGALLAAGWDGTVPLLDPMCGSGTIPIEAALLARRIPPGWNRHFAFERWPTFEPGSYERERDGAQAAMLDRSPVAIHGSDRDPGAIEAATANGERAGVASDVVWRQCALSAIEPPAGMGLVLTNPPYGTRLGERDRLRNLYAQLGHVLRRTLSGWRLTLLSADRALEAEVGLTLLELVRTENGGLPIRILTGETTAATRRER